MHSNRQRRALHLCAALIATVLVLGVTVATNVSASASEATPTAAGLPLARSADRPVPTTAPEAAPTPAPTTTTTAPPAPPATTTTTVAPAPTTTIPAVAPVVANNRRLRAPVLDVDVPDPVLATDGTTFAVFSTNVAGLHVPVRTSSDLHTWSEPIDALAALPTWGMPDKTWAPAVERIGDRWVLAVAVHEAPGHRHCIGLFESAALTGPYVSTGDAAVCAERGVIDPDLFVAADGSATIYWKEAGSSARHIMGAPLDPATLTVTGRAVELVHGQAGWEGFGVENPTMVDTGEGLVLLYSGNWWTDGRYGIGLSTCEGPLGPCTKLTVAEPWLATAHGAVGPGGQTVIQGPGGQFWLGFHAWSNGVGYDNGAHRALHIEALGFLGARPVLLDLPS